MLFQEIDPTDTRILNQGWTNQEGHIANIEQKRTKSTAQWQLWRICLQMFSSSRRREGEGEKLLSQVM